MFPTIESDYRLEANFGDDTTHDAALKFPFLRITYIYITCIAFIYRKITKKVVEINEKLDLSFTNEIAFSIISIITVIATIL